jgi:predicted metal-binding protein
MSFFDEYVPREVSNTRSLLLPVRNVSIELITVQLFEPEKAPAKKHDVDPDGNKIIAVAHALGNADAKLIQPSQVSVREWVRLKCQYGCDLYAKKLTCPPFTPTIEETKRMLSEYHKILLLKFEQRPITEKDHDKFMEELNKREDQASDKTLKIEKELMLKGYYKAFALEPGTCNKCNECGPQPGKCKFPSEARPTPESLAIDIFETVKNAGWQIEIKTAPNLKWTNYALILVE